MEERGWWWFLGKIIQLSTGRVKIPWPKLIVNISFLIFQQANDLLKQDRLTIGEKLDDAFLHTIMHNHLTKTLVLFAEMYMHLEPEL